MSDITSAQNQLFDSGWQTGLVLKHTHFRQALSQTPLSLEFKVTLKFSLPTSVQ